MRIMAIDPGYEKMGVAVLEKNLGKEVLLFSECFKTSRKDSAQKRLCALGKEIGRIIDEFKPRSLAIEKLFFAGNQKTAMLVSEARGVIVYEATRAGLSVTEYTPLEVKVAVTGYGRSTKEQIKYMAEKLVDIKKSIKEDDEYDAIALGLTYFARENKSFFK
ncbi:MAG: Crossover junction endodeoxyribonuclease RuvC [Parcubacteria group bacterium GW2011_GWA2_44_15]|nr:MAG: Crossover junction endodeoxyribonuclease RuvC [Parcubacteria group bacterium GW2011_GWA2_44_15]